jgi:hypothetical protein
MIVIYILNMLYILRDWVRPEKLLWYHLCSNPLAIDYIEANCEKLFWGNIWINPNAIHLFAKSPNLKHNWYHVSKNPGAIHLLSCNTDHIFWPWFFTYNSECMKLIHIPPHTEINWFGLCQNHSADVFSYLQTYLDTLDLSEKCRYLEHLSSNQFAVSYIMSFPDWIHHVDFSAFSANSHSDAVHWLIQNPSYIDWHTLSSNTNPIAVEWLFSQHFEHIDWVALSGNPSAIWILEKYTHMICWETLSSNPGIFELNYTWLHKRRNILHAELRLWFKGVYFE